MLLSMLLWATRCLSLTTWQICPKEKMVEQIFRRKSFLKAMVPLISSTRLSLFKNLWTSHLIILSTFCGVRKTCHRGVHFFKGISCLGSWVFIWVDFNRPLPECFLKVVVCAIFLDCKHLVVVFAFQDFTTHFNLIIWKWSDFRNLLNFCRFWSCRGCLSLSNLVRIAFKVV